MKTQIATVAGKLVVVSSLAMVLSLGAGQVTAEQAGKKNYFVQHPGSAGGRTDVDRHDPYAPVDLRPALIVESSTLAVDRFTTTTTLANEWTAPPAPDLPGRPY